MKLINTLKVLILALILATGLQIAAAAWTSAPENPPSANISAPLNVGGTLQRKTGSLHVNSESVAPIGLTVNQIFEVTSVLPDATRIYLNEYGDGSGNYSGVEMRRDGTFRGGIFKEGATDAINIWNGTGPIVAVGQDSNTTFAGQIKIVGGQPAAGKVLVAVDGTGLARWEALTCTPN